MTDPTVLSALGVVGLGAPFSTGRDATAMLPLAALAPQLALAASGQGHDRADDRRSIRVSRRFGDGP